VNAVTKHKTPDSGNLARNRAHSFSNVLTKKNRNRTAQVGNCNRTQTKLKLLKGTTDQWSAGKPVVTSNGMETWWSSGNNDANTVNF